MSELDALVRGWLGVELARALPVWLLVTLRTVPLAFVAPWLGWKGTASFARVSVALVIALALTPLALQTAPALPAGWLPLALLGLREALIGVAFAIASSLPLWALGWTGALVDRWRGSPHEGVLGPSEGASPLGALHVAAGVVLFVMLGGHRLALAAFADGFVDTPVGAGASPESVATFALGVGRLITAALELAVVFAAPAAIAFVLLEAVLGLAARVAPALSLWTSAVPLRAALGVAVALVGLAALLPRLGPLFTGSVEAAAELVRTVGG